MGGTKSRTFQMWTGPIPARLAARFPARFLATCLTISMSVGFLATASVPVLAQTPDWLKGVFGDNSSTAGQSTSARPRDAQAQPALNDLRPGASPMRSDAMLGAITGAIERYSQIQAKGGWPTIPGKRTMRPGDDDERLPIVRKRLAATGDLRSGGSSGYSFDGVLEVAVRQFQERHGLRVSGRVDPATIQAMNVPVEARINQLKLNYQRVDNLIGQHVEPRYVMVNVAGFQLEAVSQNVVELRHRVIAGKPGRQTPEVKASIRALNFFPYWRVPDSVATLDLIPRLRKEPEYLAKEQIKVLSGDFRGPILDATTIDWTTADSTHIKFRQEPGTQNALGLVRLDMPNEHGVYMHDTPMKPLFGQRARDFSAGCVRVQDVFDLAAWVGREEPGMDRKKVDEILAGGNAVDIVLKVPVPVYFTYITAWAEQDGQVVFRPDIYGRDGNREVAGAADPDAPPLPHQANALAP